MKKKICMLTLAIALSATALVGCSSNKEADQTEYEGETETSEDLDVIPENAADDANNEEDAAEDTSTEADENAAEDASTEADENAAEDTSTETDENAAEDTNADASVEE